MKADELQCPISLTSPESIACPFPNYDLIRQEQAIYQDPVTHFYVVTRYDDLRAIADDPYTFSNNTGQMGSRAANRFQNIADLYKNEGFEHLDTLVTNDPPSHTHYRSLVDKAFNAIRVRAAEQTIQSITDKLIAAFPEDAPFDYVKSFAIPLPVHMIADQLGVPPERSADFKRWSDALLEQANIGLSNEELLAIARNVVEMQQFFVGMVRDTRKHPTQTLLSDLANLRFDGELMSERELVSILQQILVAGNETTTNTLSAAVLRLTQDQQLQDELRAAPQLVRNFCEEVLRLDAPLQAQFRRATKATVIGETTIPENAILEMRYGAGNRDPEQYESRNAVDLQRKSITQHLTFGHGIHFCLGNQLARSELRIAITHLLAQTTSIRLANVEDNILRQSHFFAYGLRKLMIEITRT